MTKIFYTDIFNVNLSDIDLSLLTKERIDKANLINNELKKIQSLASYLLLRYAFNKLNIDINKYRFSYIANKPFIEGLGYFFNITHSNNIVAVVISDEEVGLDCEMVDTTRNLNLLKSYLFTTKETAEFDLFSDVEKYEYFYQKWVMKEAYFKKRGLGLSKSFNKTDNLDYPIIKITDKNNDAYFVSCTCVDYEIGKIEFKQINTI